jgi:hypothetical protein
MKKLLFFLIALTTFTNVSYAQKGLSIEGGLGTSHAPSFISLNYDIPLNDNFYWTLSAGAPSIVTGVRYANYITRNNHTLVFGVGFFDGTNEMLVRYSWVKEKEIGYSGNWSFNYGMQIFLVTWYYGQVHSDPGEPQIDDDMWYAGSFLSTKGDFLVLKYLPMPLVNLKYQF